MAGGQERRRRGHARQARCRTRPGPARGDGAAPGAAAAPAHRVGGCGAALDCSWRAADRKSTRLNSSHLVISYAVFCLKKKKRSTMKCEIYSIAVVDGLADVCNTRE